MIQNSLCKPTISCYMVDWREGLVPIIELKAVLGFILLYCSMSAYRLNNIITSAAAALTYCAPESDVIVSKKKKKKVLQGVFAVLYTWGDQQRTLLLLIHLKATCSFDLCEASY